MPTSRPTPLRRLGALALALPALVAAACGDDGGGAFCAEMREVDAELREVDPTSAEGVERALDRLREVDPLAEIEEAWTTFLDTYQALADVDVSDPEAIGSLDAERLERADEAWDEIADHLREECGIDV